MSEPQTDDTPELTPFELEDVSGGLPAVQKVREAAGRITGIAVDPSDS